MCEILKRKRHYWTIVKQYTDLQPVLPHIINKQHLTINTYFNFKSDEYMIVQIY